MEAAHETLPVVLAGLYLRGGPRAVQARRGAWPAVLRTLRQGAPALREAADCLRSGGHWTEALVIEEAPLLAWARARVEAGEVLTAACEAYPFRWIDALGSSAPPAVWKRGDVPSGPCFSIVGSRSVTGAVGRFCREVAAEAARLGHAVVSGGAVGCDRAAASGTPASALIEILPCGFGLRSAGRGCQLTVCAPDEEFATGTAMERNALIYAASDFTFVGEARFREGGTWTGAVEAHRRSLCRLLVREDADNQALRALVALGAVPLASAAGLEAALSAPGPQRRLFGDTVAERRAVGYAAA